MIYLLLYIDYYILKLPDFNELGERLNIIIFENWVLLIH